MKKNFPLGLSCVLVILIFSGYSGGCATYGGHNDDVSTDKLNNIIDNSYDDPMPSIQRGKNLVIISEPSGARIEIANMYIGKTPLTVNVNDHCKACFDCISFRESHADVCNGTVTIVANPVRKGDYVQYKSISCRQFFEGGKVYFDMNLVPASEVNK